MSNTIELLSELNAWARERYCAHLRLLLKLSDPNYVPIYRRSGTWVGDTIVLKLPKRYETTAHE